MDERLTTLLADAATSEGRRSAANLMGWLSLGSWVTNMLPCIWENYKLQSGEGVSFWFILIWLVGDLTNFAGSYRQGLLPTMILLAVYYTLCDLIIMGQIYYYRYKASHPSPSPSQPVSGSTETAPLLSSAPTSSSADLTSSSPPRKKTSKWGRFKAALILYSLAFGVILIVGFGGWLITEGRIRIPGRGGSRPQPGDGEGEGDAGGGEKWDTGAQVVGWISAAAYLGSRLPQILKNMKTKCHGLSMLFFITGLIGNVTYTSSILLASTAPAHIWINLSWLVGAAGTIFLDFIVLWQFWLYRKERLAMDEAATGGGGDGVKDGEEGRVGESDVLAVI